MERVWDGVSLEGTPPCHGGSFRWLSRKSCEQYASSVYEACRDAFRHLFVAYQGETKLLGQMLYYVLNNRFRNQENRRWERNTVTSLSSRIASRGIVLADSLSAESYGENAPGIIHIQTSSASEFPSSLTRGQNITTLTWLKEKLSAFWLHMARGWPTIY